MSLKDNLKKADRALDRMTSGTEKEVLRAYKRGLKEIDAKLATVYRKYADSKGNLSYAEMAKYNRLRNLEKDITQEMSKLASEQIKITRKNLKNVYQESYYRTAFSVEAEVQAKLRFGQLPEKQITAAITNPYDRIGWPDRSREGVKVAVRQVREEIAQGLIQGKSYPQTARAVKERLDMAAGRAIRIVQTESNRVRNAGRYDSFKQAENEGVIMQKEWVSALDDNTREDHGEADGQIVGLDDPFDVGGEELMHPGDPAGSAANVINCRCSFISVIEGFEPKERRARLTDEEYQRRLADADGDKSKVSHSEVIPYTTYSEWYKNRIA